MLHLGRRHRPRAKHLESSHADTFHLELFDAEKDPYPYPEGHFASGSMGPKVDAACRFVEQGGTRSVISSLDQITDAVAGRAGTVVVPH